MTKCVFLDRDGVLNQEIGTYVYRREDLIIPEEVPAALGRLKAQGYLLVVVTNQAGIAKGLYTKREVLDCHQLIQATCWNALDALYFCPYHPDYDSESLGRKPGSLMLEKAAARFGIDFAQAWLIGDRLRDIEAARRVRVKGILIQTEPDEEPDKEPAGDHWVVGNLTEAVDLILSHQA